MRRKVVGCVVIVVAGALAHASPALAQGLPPAGPQCDGSAGEWAGRVMLFTEGSNAPSGAVDGICTAAASKRIAVDLAKSSDVTGLLLREQAGISVHPDAEVRKSSAMTRRCQAAWSLCRVGL